MLKLYINSYKYSINVISIKLKLHKCLRTWKWLILNEYLVMQIVKKLYLKLFDKNKYHFEKNEDKAKKNLAIYKEKIEKKINDILNEIDKSKVLNFKHSGHCGDIICSLPVVKELAPPWPTTTL